MTDRARVLTRREAAMLRMLGQGATRAKMAKRLSMTEGSLRVTLYYLIKRLGLKNSPHAAAWFTRIETRGRLWMHLR